MRPPTLCAIGPPSGGLFIWSIADAGPHRPTAASPRRSAAPCRFPVVCRKGALAVGGCVGRVVRLFDDGFAIKFVEPQKRDDLDRVITRYATASRRLPGCVEAPRKMPFAARLCAPLLVTGHHRRR